MADLCVTCGRELEDGRCATCAGGEPAPTAPDPLIGTTIADRYEIVRLLSDGGMARLYQGVQRSLDRPVAIKMIHPDLLGSDPSIVEELVARFLVEAQAASRLNHPNVISIYDFGRTAPEDGGHLFQVMELLSGRDLYHVLYEGEPMPMARVVGILRQVLAALSEAHYLGITHRDIKPENVLLEPRRGGLDHVKVIDFGVAKFGGNPSVTRKGRIVGSAYYTAPEQARGDPAAPAADLYSVGVMLYELLTGMVPFDAGSLVATWKLHMSAPRPDPRVVAPDRSIPDALAEVCMRAMAIEPADRFEDADAFAEAIVDAAGFALGPSALPPLRVADSPAGSSPPAPTAPATLPPAPVIPPPPATLPWASIPPVSLPPGGTGSSPPAAFSSPADMSPIPARVTTRPMPIPRVDPPEVGAALVGRSEELRWACAALESTAPAVVVWGRSGVGKTRLLHQIAATLPHADARFATAPRTPRCEVGYATLAEVVLALTGLDKDDPLLRTGKGDADPWISGGLRVIFSEAPVRSTVAPDAMRKAAAAALRWAVKVALDQAPDGRVLLVLDDLDRVDGASRQALSDLLSTRPPRGLSVLASAEERPDPTMVPRVAALEIVGLEREDAAEVLRELGSDPRPLEVLGLEGRFEPLHLVLMSRWNAGDPTLSGRLDRLVEARVRSLGPSERQVLQAIALLGGGTREEITPLLPRPDELDEALRRLVHAGLCAVAGRTAYVPHSVVADVVLAWAPTGARAEMHAKAALALEGRPRLVELRAFHAILGEPDFGAFLLVEESARQRVQRGDADGAVSVLGAGMRAARTLLMRGELEAATSATVTFGQKLATILADAERFDEARGVLTEVLSRLPPGDPAGIRIGSLLAGISRRTADR